MTSKAQQAVYETLPPHYQGAPLPFPKNIFEQIRNEIAGDVAGATAEQTARNADAMTRHLQNEVYPGLVARNPNLTPEQAREGMKKVVKAGGMATSEIFDDKGNISADYRAV